MSYGLIFLSVLLVACLLAGPAVAGIRRFTDSQGVIHISNTSPSTAKQITAEPPAPTPDAPENFSNAALRPGSGPPVASFSPVKKAQAEEKIDAPSTPKIISPLDLALSVPAMWLESQLSFTPTFPEIPGSTRPQDTEKNPAPLPVQKAAYGPDIGQFSIPHVLPSSSPPLPGEHAKVPEATARQTYEDRAENLSPLDKSLLDLSWPPKQAATIPGETENQEAEGTLKASVAAESIPVKKAACEPAARGIVPPPAPLAARPLKSEPGTEGGIRRFRDRQGVLVISNVEPVPKAYASGSAPTEGQGTPDKIISEKKLEQAENLPKAPGLQPVSFNPDQPAVSPFPTAAGSARGSALARRGSIRCYKDKDGVLHIDNQGPGREEFLRPPAALAVAQNQETTGPPGPRNSLPENDPGNKLAVEPAAPIVEKAAKPRPLNLAAADSLQEEIGAPLGVQRYRDRLGIWQFQPADHWLMETPPLLRPASSTQEVLLTVFDTAARLPEVSRPPQVGVRKPPPVTKFAEVAWAPAPSVPQEPSSKYRGITAVRDRRGMLVITNALPQLGIGSAPSWALASAQLEPIIQEAARAYKLPPTLIRAVIKAESNFVNLAVSPKGAMGLMQLMPGTARFLGVLEPFNPRENIHGGCRYLRMMLDSFGGSLPLALAAYNAGPQRVVASGYRVPAITETQEFLIQVIGRYLTDEKKARKPWT